ncbi:hypothetical protein ACH5RR_007922 [Cinchona calisaya]|uniref:Uncharacterized protein n=1 Tax=Cinchona calisaya TaxID=153742 RepID=A0ABD3ADT4_9GENT
MSKSTVDPKHAFKRGPTLDFDLIIFLMTLKVGFLKLAKMSLDEDDIDESSQEVVEIAADIEWKMLVKSKFFLLGAALFSGVSATPVVVLKTRQQVSKPATLLHLHGWSSFHGDHYAFGYYKD